MPRGRPNELTPQVEQRICKAIKAGQTRKTAAIRGGISYRTFRRWMVRGEKATRGKFWHFCHAVRESEAEAQARVVKHWQAFIPRDWHAARAFLQTRYPEEWGKRETVEHTGKRGKPIEGNVKHEHSAKPDPEAFRSFMDDLLRAGIPDVHRNGHAKPVDS